MLKTLAKKALKRAGRRNWIQTYTGLAFNPTNPQSGLITTEDIAHALSNLCRFTGHCKRFYSVAEHSIRVSALVERRVPYVAPYILLRALLHDAGEAYLNDIATPIKKIPGLHWIYTLLEEGVDEAVCNHYGLPSGKLPRVIWQADKDMLVLEARQLMNHGSLSWLQGEMPEGERPVFCLSPDEAKAAFWLRFRNLASRMPPMSGIGSVYRTVRA